jgi:hypothetical protein
MGIKFQCSNGWFQQFKQQCNITWQVISAEGSAVDVEALEKWHKNMTPILKQYVPKGHI